MTLLENLQSRLGIFGELLGYFWSHKWWWLTPVILVLVVVGIFLVFAASSPIAPFLYTLF